MTTIPVPPAWSPTATTTAPTCTTSRCRRRTTKACAACIASPNRRRWMPARSPSSSTSGDRLVEQAPGDRFARAHRHQLGVAEGLRSRHGPAFLLQPDAAAIARQAVEIRAVEAGEALQLVECARQVEGFGIQLDRRVRAIDA